MKVAYLESLTAVVFSVQNLPKVAAHAKRHGAITMIDNSWATSLHQHPNTLEVDIVIHSTSKYITGHSDSVAGAVIASAAHVATIRDMSLPLLRAKLAPFEAWLLVRGPRTLVPLMYPHRETANCLSTGCLP